ncbi:MAG: hypothetical protein LC104_06660 [Bacteroidales bacterium]|nr:hypothetical protein [Bacteroidales bacterium]
MMRCATSTQAYRAERATANRTEAERERVRQHVDRIRLEAAIREAMAAMDADQRQQPQPHDRW